MKIKASFLLRDLDKTLAIAGVIFSLILIVYMSRQNGRVVYLLTGFLALISCLLWLAIRKSHSFRFEFPKSTTLTHLWGIFFFGLYTLSVLSVYLRPDLYERPLLYFLLTATMAGIIACQILTASRRTTCFIVIEIILLGTSIAWSQLLIFPNLVGIDPWYHIVITERILNFGNIPDGFIYSKLPLFHIIIATTSLITDLPYKFAAMVSVSLAQIICNGLFVFLIADRLFKNHRIGLLAALMVMIANHQIWMSYWSIPNAFAGIFVPIGLYLIFFKYRGGSLSKSAILSLLVLVFATIILTHTITAMCMAIILLITWSGLVIYDVYNKNVQNIVPLSIPFAFIVAMFGWWTYASSSIGSLSTLIEGQFDVDIIVRTPQELRNYAASIPVGEQLFNYLGMFLFFAFSFIGIFYMISRRGNGSTFTMAWIGIVPLAIGFISLISGHSVVDERWYYFAQIFLSIPLTIAIYTLGTWKTRNINFIGCFLFGFVVILSFLMIMSPQANVDNLSFSQDLHNRAAPTESELTSITTLTAKTDDPMLTDEYFSGILSFQYPQISSFSQNIYANDYDSQKHKIILIREATVGKPFKIYDSYYKLDYDLNDKLDGLGFSRIYHSNAGSGYRKDRDILNA